MNQEGALACCAVCNIETHRRCSRCLNIYYCNTDHQREDWKRHKSECIPKLTKQSKKKGSKVVIPTNCRDRTPKKGGEIVQNSEQNTQQDPVTIEGSKPIDRKHSENSKKPIGNEGSPVVISSKQTSPVLSENLSCDSKGNTVNNIQEPTVSKANSVISSVVCLNKDSTKQSAITYEGSSEKEIYTESAQQLGTAGFMSPADPSDNVLKSLNRTVDNEMTVMPGMFQRMTHKEYPEASLRGSSVTNNFNFDNSGPCYKICQQVIRDMTTYGVCVINNFLGRERGLAVRKEVLDMYRSGIFIAGQLVSDPGSTVAHAVRSDRITWIDGREPHCTNTGNLINQVDSIIIAANKMPNNGRMGDYNINTRTKAMVACYPGSGSNYVKHVDNPNKDGRCITAIYYLNLDWDVRVNGGLLRVFPEGTEQVANIEPIFDRMLFFWSDRRNPHEVQPAYDTRYAITLWYFDAQERKEALRLYKNRGSQPSSSK